MRPILIITYLVSDLRLPVLHLLPLLDFIFRFDLFLYLFAIYLHAIYSFIC